MKTILDYVDKTLFGYELDSWNYDDSMSLDELNKYGFPYSMICLEINENTIIAIGTENESPNDFYHKNLNEKFELNPAMQPRLVNESFLGKKNIFYLKRKVEKVMNLNIKNFFEIYGFKEKGNITGTINSDLQTENIFEFSFDLLQKKIIL